MKYKAATLTALLLGVSVLDAGDSIGIDFAKDGIVLTAPTIKDPRAWIVFETSADLITWTELKRQPATAKASVKVKRSEDVRFFRFRIEPKKSSEKG